MTVLYSDNFDSDTTGALPSGWTAAVGTWKVQASSLAVSGANALVSTSGNNGDAVLYTGGASTADGSVSWTTRAANVNGFMGGLFRFDAGYQNGYFIGITPSTRNVSFFSRVSGTYSQITTVNLTASQFPAPATNDVIAQECRFVGSTLEYRVWNVTQGQSRPSTASASVTDTTKTTAGYCGIYEGVTGAGPFDDFVVSDNSSTATPTPTPTTTIAPNDANIAYSPGNWTGATATSNKTINAGAGFKVLLKALTSAVLTFDVSNMGSPASQVYYRFNGYETQSPWQKATVAASVTLNLPSDTSSAPYQFLEVVVKSTSETLTRWSPTSATAVIFTGMTVSSGTTTLAPMLCPYDVLFMGDSITEAVRAVNQSAANDTDRNDALMGWARAVGVGLGCEVGVIGFGGTGWTVSGSGGVPALPSSYNLVMPGVNRTFPSGREPIAIFVNMGTNDSGATAANVTSAVQTFLNGMLSLYPTASIVVMRPFNGTQASAIQAGITAVGSGRVFWVDTTGVFNTAYGADSLNLHPNGANNLGLIAPALISLLAQFARPRRFTTVAQ